MSDVPKKKKRWWKRRWVFWSIWLPGVVLGLLGVLLWWLGWNEKRQWEELKAELEAKGENFEIRDYLGDPVDRDQNVLADRWFREFSDNLSDGFTTAAFANGGASSSGPYSHSYLEMLWCGASPSEGKTLLVAQDFESSGYELKSNAEAAEILLSNYRGKKDLRRELARVYELPYWQPLDLHTTSDFYGVDWGSTWLIDLMRFESRKACLSAIVGDTKGARESIERGFKILHWSRQNQFLIGELVEITCEAVLMDAVWQLLATRGEDPETLDFLDGILRETEASPDDFIHTMRGEMAIMITVFLSMAESGSLVFAGDLGDEILGRLAVTDFFVYRSIRVGGNVMFPPLHAYESQSPERSLLDLGDRIDDSVMKHRASRNWLSKMTDKMGMAVGEGWSKFIEREVRKRAVCEIARSQIAAARFKLNEGRYPSGYDELVPTYLDEVPLDPYDLKPMRWTKDEAGKPLIYAIGPDLTDDGGVDLDDDDQGDIRWLMMVQGINDEYGYLKQDEE